MVLISLCRDTAYCVLFDTDGIRVHASVWMFALQTYAGSCSTPMDVYVNGNAQGNGSAHEYSLHYEAM